VKWDLSDKVMPRTGHNSFHNYNIFKDDKHVMFTAGNGAVCRSIYYCLDVSHSCAVWLELCVFFFFFS
jgi:hypothetical protein